MKPAGKATRGIKKSAAEKRKNAEGFTPEERAAMRERLEELKAQAKRGRAAEQADGEQAVLAKIATLSASDRELAERVHALIMANAPALSPRTWYGMPAYAKDGKVVCFFQSADKFKSRYATLGFSDKANLDSGHMWPTAFALKQLTAEEEKTIAALIRRAAS